MAETKRLEVGDKAPAFTLLDADGKKVSLSSYKGRKVIIYFYPAVRPRQDDADRIRRLR
ncbi:Alkyl hydroperoxide reductase/ Thiol specific antioxidant/ Mal allergen [Mycobacteroides abscessus subsp. massiliense]|nr:Alkyl hydroperoxide reductase/ Thiol specific antioxidant/ Mal allergen [Mycobacteroides abscessus subsp. massiliense]